MSPSAKNQGGDGGLSSLIGKGGEVVTGEQGKELSQEQNNYYTEGFVFSLITARANPLL